MQPAIVVVGQAHDVGESLEARILAALGTQPLSQVVVHEARGRVAIVDDLVGERHVDRALLDALDRGAVMVHPEDLEAALGEPA